MKQKLLILSFLICAFQNVKAQYVNIPDSNFRKILIKKFPAAFNLNGEMDTTNSQIISATYLRLYQRNISNISGIEYFDNLDELFCDEPITYLPHLSNTLTKLTIWSSLITSFNTYPPNLKKLYLSGHDLSIPQSLNISFPNSLTELILTWSNLSSIQLQPNNIKTIDLSHNRFTTMPTSIPSDIINLDLSDNLITNISNLNTFTELKYFRALNNKLSACPNISSLNNLFELDLSNNLITTIGQLPKNLYRLVLNKNNLSSLPQLPQLLYTLECDENPNLTCLPLLPDYYSFYTAPNYGDNFILNIDIAKIKCLPNLPLGTTITNNRNNITLTSYPVCSQSFNPNNCNVYAQKKYLYLSDPILSKYLIKICDTCFGASFLGFDISKNKVALDTNSSIMKIKTINLYTDFIGDPENVDGIEWFKNLDSLLLSPMKIKKIAKLPNQLKYFDCDYGCGKGCLSILDSFTNFPDSLRELGLKDGAFSSLPKLPKSLKKLNLSNTRMYCMPELSDTLDELYIDTTITKCLNLNYPVKNILVSNGLSASSFGLYPWYYGSLVTSYPTCNPTNNINGCPSHSANFKGLTFIDVNNNSTKDATEPILSNNRIELNDKFNFTNSSGNYSIYSDTSGLFTVKPEQKSLFKVVPDSFSITVPLKDTTITQNFAYQFLYPKDSIAMSSTNLAWRVRPGSFNPIMVQIHNVGTTNLSNVNYTLNYDNTMLSYDSSSIAGVANNSNSLSVNISSMPYGSSKSFMIYFKTKTTVSIGDTLKCYALTTSGTASATDTIRSAVFTSFDPNDKEATPELTTQQVAERKRINYTIRFENTGNDTAFNIVVADTLSSKLKISSLKMVATSHNCKVTTEGNIVYFEFKNILLPDSFTNKIKCHGFIRFTIETQPNLVVGDVIPNSASIYFDYNKPVLTNTATTIIKNKLLPVLFKSFTTKQIGESNAIENKWQVGNEINVKQYVIQKSMDGRIFKSVGVVEAKGKLEYGFIDENRETQTSRELYYRIVAVDNDGKETYSSTNKLEIKKLKLEIRVYPNPAKEFIVVESKESINEIKLINTLGKQIFTLKPNSNKASINTTAFAKGTYYVQIITNNKTMNEKLIIE